MVLKRVVCFILLGLMLQACSHRQHQHIIAVHQGASGEMTSSSARTSYTPTPRATFGLLNKAHSAAEQGAWNSALRYLDQAQRMAPDEAQVYLQYGEIYIKQNQDDKAEAMFKRVLSLSEEGDDAHERAQDYLRQFNDL